MNSKYLISVIIPAYNSEKTLERAVNSIENVDGLEIIIVENGSSDNTTNIAENLAKKDKRVRVYHSNKGVSNARNCGIEKANGKWITFLDSDDSYRAGALELMTRYAAKSAELISFGHYNGDNKISQCKNTIICDSSDCISVKARMIERPNVYMLSIAKLFLREVIVENNIRFSEKLSLAEDSDFVINYMRYINRIIISPRCIYNYIVNNTSTMNTYDRQIIKKYLYSLQLTKTRIKDQPIEIKEAYGKYVLHHLNFMMVRGPYSASCKLNILRKLIVLKKTCKTDIIDNAIRSLKIRDINNFRLIPILFIKFKMNTIASFIYLLRGKRNERRITKPKFDNSIINELSSENIKNIELELLINFDKFCQKNNIYYTLCGGTLLGAIRHKGFIPWDDDIDVLVPRSDYDRILNSIDLDYSDIPKYAVFGSWKNKKTDYPFIKLLDMRTLIDSKYVVDKSSNHLWIDIFPIDGNPSNDRRLTKLYKKSLRLRGVLKIKMAKFGEGKTTLKKIIKPILKVLFLPLSKELLCEMIDKNAKKYKFQTCEVIGGVVWGYGKCEAINKEKYMKSVDVQFENHMFKAPQNYDEYLTNLYGEYMKLPPIEKRVTHDMKAFFVDYSVD